MSSISTMGAIAGIVADVQTTENIEERLDEIGEVAVELYGAGNRSHGVASMTMSDLSRLALGAQDVAEALDLVENMKAYPATIILKDALSNLQSELHASISAGENALGYDELEQHMAAAIFRRH